MFLPVVVVTTIMLSAAVTVVAEPYDAKAIFYSGTVLSKALADIAQMQEPELRAFTRYLAECDDELVDVPTRHACTAAKTTYSVEFGGKRALDDMMHARSLLNLNESAKPKALDAPALDIIVKEAKIIASLQDAARERFRVLRSSGQSAK
jgi:hypothetical protein